MRVVRNLKPNPLLMKSILERSAELFPKQEIVDRDFRYTYLDAYERMCRLANVLEDIGVKVGERAATLAWNTHRHFELYWAIPCVGSVLHTVNARLFQDQIAKILNHAEDKVVFLDDDFITLVEGLRDKLKTVKAYVIMTDKAKIPETKLDPAYEYENLLKKASSSFQWPELEESATATLDYTTGTTGEPKGVCFTHRMLFLHTLITSLPEAFHLTRHDTVLHMVPMFHAHSWGLPYDSTLVGAKQVFPGKLEVKLAMELIQREKVTITAAVPTIYAMMLEQPEADEYNLNSLKFAFSGGAPTSPGLVKSFREKFRVQLITSYGLTETCPVLTKAHLKPHMKDWPSQKTDEVHAKTGLPLPGVDVRVVDTQGHDIPHDGVTIGEIIARGSYVATEYYKEPEKTAESWDSQGYFHTGDAAVIDEEGYILIVDRYKDLIRSGGEIIPSVTVDKVIEQHRAVAHCATIAMPHGKWGERPLACIELKPAHKGKLDQAEIRNFCEGKMPQWHIPDKVLFVDSMPMTSAGKKDKKSLKSQKIWERIKA